MDIHDIVMKLIGPIRPIGESGFDRTALENLKALSELVDELVGDIEQVAVNHSRLEFSLSECGKQAKRFLEDLRPQPAPPNGIGYDKRTGRVVLKCRVCGETTLGPTRQEWLEADE